MDQAIWQGVITGRVQQVGYRRATQQQAHQLGIKGWVRNLPNGQVEVLLCGSAILLEDMRLWLWQGPPLAKVTDVALKPLVDNNNYTSFEII